MNRLASTIALSFSIASCTLSTDDSPPEGVAGNAVPGGAVSATGGADSDVASGGNTASPASGGMGAGSTGGDPASGGSESGSDPGCERGITNIAMTVCCPAACGFCGGTSCEDNPGGEAECCAGAIAASGVSCSSAEAPCALPSDDGSGGTPGTGGADATGGAAATGGGAATGGSDPGVCTLDTPVTGLPDYDFTMHNVLTKRMERSDFCDADKWYSEWLGADGKPVQEFSLQQGDDMADYVAGGRSHQRCEFEDGVWATKGSNDWIEWEGRMLINKHPENTITIGQMFGPNGPDARIEIRTNGSVGVGSLNGSGGGNVTLSASDMVGKSFKIRMRTNGDRVEVYYNGSKAVDRPTDGNNGQKWHFRWGVYSNDIPQEASPLTNTVTELVVSG